MYSKSRLDILSFNALDGDKHLTKVSNKDFLELLKKFNLSEEDNILYAKLLKHERNRYIAVDNLADLQDINVDDNYAKRYAKYKKSNTKLSITCVKELLEKNQKINNIKSDAIKAIVSNTTVGGMVPNITSCIANALNIKHNIKVIDLGYMGCATALLALELIEQQLKAGEVGIVISSELTSVMTNLLADNNPSLVANTVFGDGIGAFLVAKRPHKYIAMLNIKAHTTSLIASDEALAAITYDVNPIYHEIKIHGTIQKVAGEGIKQVLPSLIKNHLINFKQKISYLYNKKIPVWQQKTDYVVLHTAGNKILQGINEKLSLNAKQTKHNFSAFNNYGNTSSASIYYSLDYLYKENNLLKPKQKILFLGYGSGFFTRGCIMEIAHAK